MTGPERPPLSPTAGVEWAPLPLHHGAIGNGRVLALVGPDTNIDWLCLPRFDSPSVFARLLDQERGGTWAFKPVERLEGEGGLHP